MKTYWTTHHFNFNTLKGCLSATALLLIATSCSTVKNSTLQVELDQDSTIFSPSLERPLEKKKGDLIEVHETPLLVESTGHIAALILPVTPHSQTAKLHLKDWEQQGGEAYESKTSQIIDLILPKINQIQEWMVAKKTTEALNLIDELITKFPKVVQLKLIKASCLTVMGDRQKAKILLESALQMDPTNKSAQELLKFLSAKEKP